MTNHQRRNPAEINQDALRAAAPLVVQYKNWRGETSIRRVVPIAAPRYGTSAWHPEPQWLLLVLDVEKDKEREYAMRDMVPVATLPQEGAAGAEPVAWLIETFPADRPGRSEVVFERPREPSYLDRYKVRALGFTAAPSPAPAPDADADAARQDGAVIA